MSSSIRHAVRNRHLADPKRQELQPADTTVSSARASSRAKSVAAGGAAIAAATVLTLGAWSPLLAEEENEQQVKMADLPAAVQTTIKNTAGSNEIIKNEKKTEDGKTVYEAVVNKSGKEWAIEVDQNGKFLKQYDESKEKEEKGEKGE